MQISKFQPFFGNNSAGKSRRKIPKSGKDAPRRALNFGKNFVVLAHLVQELRSKNRKKRKKFETLPSLALCSGRTRIFPDIRFAPKVPLYSLVQHMSAMSDSDSGIKRPTKTHKKLRGVPLWVAAPAEHFHTRNENKS